MREFGPEKHMPQNVVDKAQQEVGMAAPHEGLWHYEAQAGALHERGREGSL